MYRLIMGRNCIREVLKSAPHRLVEVYTCQKSDPLYRDLEKAGIPLIDKSKKQLSQMVSSESHQSFVAAIKERNHPTIKSFLDEPHEQSTVLILDSIYDPQNLGAIMRSCECFGVDLVIFSRNRGADITPTVAKTSAGASELIPYCKVSNLADTLKQFQQAGYWAYATSVSDTSQSIYTTDFSDKAVIIMGSEGEGVQKRLLKAADFQIHIPMRGQIDSLNVAQATAVILSALER